MNRDELINTDIQKILDQYSKFEAPLPSDLSPAAARNLPTLKNAVEEIVSQNFSDRAATLLNPIPEQVGKVTHYTIPSLSGDILTRIYTPKGEGPFPVIVYFHGGGWVIANLDVYEPTCRALCNAATSIVVSVAYRQAPENKFPAAVDDAYEALQYILKNAVSFGGDAKNIAVAGESAGGNLATVSCIRAKQEGGQLPVAQLLIYPVIDNSFNTTSYQENAQIKPLVKEMMVWFWDNYLSLPEDANNPYASPSKATDLSGLPPAFVITAELDVLRDEGEAYARQLKQAGVEVKCKRYEGAVHEFFSLSGVVDISKTALQDAATFLQQAFNNNIEASNTSIKVGSVNTSLPDNVPYLA
jgi:acetyl esterase